LVVVSGYGNDKLTPRGQRTRWLVDALRGDWEVEVVAMPEKPSSARPGGTSQRRAGLRRLAGRIVYGVLLDRWEPWAVRRFWRWRPEAEGAVLIASPWSPVVYASRRLVAARIPYLVDVGDPWVLTAEVDLAGAPTWRAHRDETFLWEHASAAIVTTGAQANSLRALFPELPILIRPNGFTVVDLPPPVERQRDPSVLRLAHFGILSASRIDPVPFLADLARSGRWRLIVLDQFGDDFGVGMDRVPTGVSVRHHTPRPWSEVIASAADYDAALVIAYPLPKLLPSKTIEYSTLPLPRIALTNPDPADALRQYAADHSGWCPVSNGEPDIADRVAAHVDRSWSAAELAPRAADAWPAVAVKLADFTSEQLGEGSRSAVRT